MIHQQLAIDHKNRGREIQVDNTKAFIYEKGTGEPVVCFHGVPASSFLYRKLINRLSENGLRGISFDLLGMGLSDRPKNYDYSWTGLGEWSNKLIKKLELGKFHLVFHDIGGPIACEVISKIPDQILSVTILNTMLVNLPQFQKPFPMWFFPVKGLGELFVQTTTPFTLKKLMHIKGIHKKEIFGKEEAKAYIEFLKGDDKAKAFLKIMRSFEPTKEKEKLYINSLNNLEVPKQIIWGMNDKGLPFEKYGNPLKHILKIKEITKTEGSHFLQEDYADILSEKIINLLKQKN